MNLERVVPSSERCFSLPLSHSLAGLPRLYLMGWDGKSLIYLSLSIYFYSSSQHFGVLGPFCASHLPEVPLLLHHLLQPLPGFPSAVEERDLSSAPCRSEGLHWCRSSPGGDSQQQRGWRPSSPSSAQSCCSLLTSTTHFSHFRLLGLLHSGKKPFPAPFCCWRGRKGLLSASRARVAFSA